MPSNVHFYSTDAVLWLLLAILGNDATDQTKAMNLRAYSRRERRGHLKVTNCRETVPQLQVINELKAEFCCLLYTGYHHVVEIVLTLEIKGG